jgi:lipopolysaccharide export LptBFGC system permease protein LptF
MIHKGIFNSFSFYFLFKGLIYLLPSVFSIVLPLSILVAVLLSLGQLSESGEIVALRAGGYSFFEIFSYLWTFSVVLSILLFFNNNWLAPRWFKKSNDYVLSMANKIARIDIKPKTFQKISDWEIYSHKVNSDSKELEQVRLFRRISDTGQSSWILRINAKKGRYQILKETGIEIELEDGQFYQANLDKPDKFLFGEFLGYKTVIAFFPPGDCVERLSPKEISTTKIMRHLRSKTISVRCSRLEGCDNARVMSQLGNRTFDADYAKKFKIEVLFRMATVISPFIFFLIASPLGIVFGKQTKTINFAISLLIVFFYYGLTFVSIVLSKKFEFFLPWLIYVPDILSISAGAYMWHKRLK